MTCRAASAKSFHRLDLVSASRRSRFFSVDAAAHPLNKTQVYLSRCHDPLVNLSVEHRLLQITPPESTVLILYVNSPCVVIGRNQNPWVELNMRRLAQMAHRPGETDWSDSPVKVVRRRSGGGTVFHDLGNVNFSVIFPTGAFDRDRHAEMVVRALQALGRAQTRVNPRHDIVMDVTTSAAQAVETFKVSGSAYKLTRLRALHHGTCLLRSPHLSRISEMLRSPAEPFIQARGVESVRSPVSNVDLDNLVFQDAVVAEFAAMYGQLDVRADFDEQALQNDQIRKGYDELASRDWIYGQTPRFSFQSHPSRQDPRSRPPVPFEKHRIGLEAKHCVIEEFRVSTSQSFDETQCVGEPLHDVHDWCARLHQAGLRIGDAQNVGTWMNEMLGTEFLKIPSPASI